LGEAVVSPGGGLIVVILPAYSGGGTGDGQKSCGGPVVFERIIPLGSDFSPGSYAVSINGVSAMFAVEDKPAAEIRTQKENISSVPQENGLPLAANEQPAAPEEQPAAPVELAAPVEHAAAEEPQKPVELANPEPDSLPSAECEVKAAFFADMSVPDGSVFMPGDAFTKTWRIRNAGSCTWKDYTLVFQDGDRMNAPDPFPLAGEVRPGDTVDISLSLTAPLKPGTYHSDWLLATPDGRIFGLGNPSVGLLWTKIGVRAPLSMAAEPVCAYENDDSVEAALLRMINAVRRERKLAELQAAERLNAAARAHSQDMACVNFVEHYGSDGSTWGTRIKAQGVKFRSAYENIFAGNPQFGVTAEYVFNWWMNSQVHRDNILNPKARQIGIGYIYYSGSEYKGYYTLNFVEP
jgi:uncharacterized protein YkwD